MDRRFQRKRIEKSVQTFDRYLEPAHWTSVALLDRIRL